MVKENIDLYICPNCHSDDLNKQACIRCGWSIEFKDEIPVLLSKQDSASITFRKYIDNYDLISSDDLENSIQDPKYLQLQTEKLFSYVPKKYIKDSDVLEVGIGKGLLLKMLLKERPRSYIGVDISMPYLKKIKGFKLVQPVLANAENLPFKEQFDFLIATDVLEHVLNVGDFLISMNRALRAGGYIIVKVPNEEDLQHYAKQRDCRYDYVHLRTFNKKLLEFTLLEAGFSTVAVHYDGYSRDRVRKFRFFNEYIRKKVNDYLLRNFNSDVEINHMNKTLARMMMRPMEVTILAKKNL